MAKRSDQPASLDPVGSFQVHYRGRLASEGIVEAESFATSLLGATKLYASLVHYAGTGKILKSNSQRNFRIYTRAAEKGNSVDLELARLRLRPTSMAVSVSADGRSDSGRCSLCGAKPRS